jgi:hypothetical protein
MKKVIKKLYAVIAIIIIAFCLPVFMDWLGLFAKQTEAEEANWSQETVPPNPDLTNGDSIFTVLEIVPYHGLGEIGYLVNGEEPIESKYLDSTSAGWVRGVTSNSIDVYYNYFDEFNNPSAGTYGKTGFTYLYQNGYFVPAANNSGQFSISSGTASYAYVGAGKGDWKAELDTETDFKDSAYWAYNQKNDNYSVENKKNVKAYFTADSKATNIYNKQQTYAVFSVKRRTDHLGNYDYDCSTGKFVLNKGLGNYDVIFAKYDSFSQQYVTSKPVYYMMNNYEIVTDNSGDYSWNIKYLNTPGDYKQVPDQFNYVGSGGNYNWVKVSDSSIPSAVNTNGYSIEMSGSNITKYWFKGQKIRYTYKFNYGWDMVNNEWFKRYVLGVDASQVKNYPVEVITLTPTELNDSKYSGYIDKADMIYINTKDQNIYIKLFENLSTEGRNLPANTNKTLSFTKCDLNWSNTEKVFKRAAGIDCNRAAVVIDSTYFPDSTAYTGTATATDIWNNQTSFTGSALNMNKLYIMLMQRDMLSFYRAFMDPNSTNPYKIKQISVANTISPTGTTGSYVRPDYSGTLNDAAYQTNSAKYWYSDTFLPYGFNENGDFVRFNVNDWTTYSTDISHGITIQKISDQSVLAKYIPNYNITKDTTNLNDNVLVMNGSEIFAGTVFNSNTVNIKDTNQYEDAVAHQISLDPSGTIPSSLTISNIMNYITNNGNGYPSRTSTDLSGIDGTNGSNLRTYVSVLNIQPTADFTASDQIIKSIYENYNIKIVHMTSPEFNSSIEDINTHYDAIYIGNSAGGFNNAPGTTFNNNTLNGKSYMNPGDSITNTSGTKENYTGNDITTTKKAALVSFINAGYTVILDSSLYDSPSTTLSLAEYLRTFITDNKATKSNILRNTDYTGTDSNLRYKFLAAIDRGLDISRPRIQLISPTITPTTGINYLYPDPVEGMKIQFALLPRKPLPSNNLYNAHLYFDANNDGLFSPSEELTITSTGFKWQNILESYYIKYIYTNNLANKNGVYAWKVMIERADNPNIRSEITGYFACTNKTTLNVLQVIDNPASGVGDYSLQSKVNDVNSLIRKYAGYGTVPVTDYNLVFTTMTVDEFLDKYQTNPYTSGNTSSSNVLQKYQMLILDNQVNSLNNSNGAIANIKDEIAKKLAVIFTKDTKNISSQTDTNNNLTTNLLEDQKTYENLSYNAKVYSTNPIYQNYIYNFTQSGLTLDKLNQKATYNTTNITKANDSTVCQYPYNIGKTIKIAGTSFEKNTTYDYNSSDASPVVGWYCLSDNYSPDVNSSTTAPYKGIYSSAPNDVKNNYYLFNRGGIYYSGINLKNADAINNDDEVKLFVNTIIAAFKSSGRPVPHPVKIVINNSDLVINVDKEQQYLYIDNDNSVSDSVQSYGYKLYFTISEATGNCNVSINKSGGSVSSLIYSTADPSVTYDTSSQKVPNGSYYVVIPTSIMKDISSENITINASVNAIDTGSTTVTLLRRSLFLLD